MTIWPGYEPERARDPRLPSPRGLRLGPALGSATGQASLGAHFDDSTWDDVVRARGWEPCEVGGRAGFCSPVLGDGVRILFAAPAHLPPHGLDEAVLLLGFREPTSDADRLFAVRGFGDGEIIFDKLVHAGAAFSVPAFLDWLDHQSVADAEPLRG